MKKILKKSLILVLTLSMILPSMLLMPWASAFANTSDVVEYDAEIMKAKGGASAIATMTFDDGVHATNEALLPLLKEYNLKASLMVVPSRIMGIAPYTSGYSNIEQLKTLMEGGYLDVQSHSYSHLYIADPSSSDYKAENNTDANRQREIPGSRDWLTDAFPSVPAIAFAVPGGSYDPAARELLTETFYAVRNGQVASGQMQTLTPMDGLNPMDWYALKCVWLNESKIDSIRAYLTTCVEKGGWFITGVHNIVGTELGKGNYEITTDTLELLFADMKAYQKSGDLWVTTFGDATRYLREYESSTVRQYKNALGMYVEVTMNDTTPGGLPLPADIFNMPLTVKVEIPDGWQRVRFSLSGKSEIVNTFTEGGKTYAYAEVVPNAGAVLMTNAEDELPTFSANAEFALVKGGAKAIATLTFDDGLKGTANALNELCAEYDCKASLIMITNQLNDREAVYWNNVFSAGYLEPESHSYSHAYIDSKHLENENQEFMDREIGGSLDDLRKYFPDYDCLAYGTPYSGYTQKGLEEIAKYFYAHRGNGGCVLVTDSCKGKVMGLDPACDTTTLGGWYRSISIRVQPEKSYVEGYENITLENILAYLDKCVTEGGWFIGSAHGIVDGENLDITIEDITVLMKAMQAYQNENKLWVATYSEATKYIRERQNSTVSAYTTGDGTYYVSIDMASYTADGLSLDTVLTNSDGTTRRLFNMPLTVKLEVQPGWEEVEYVNADGDRVLAPTFVEMGKTYAYVDALPDGPEIVVTRSRGASGEIVLPEPPAGSYTQPEGTYVPENANVTYALWANEASFLAGDDPVYESESTTLLNADVKNRGYVFLYKDLTSSEKIAPVGVDLEVNLGGHSITLPTGTLVENGRHLILSNGTVYNKGQLHAREGTYFTVDNCHFVNTHNSLGYGWGATRIVFRDTKLELNAVNTFIFLTQNTTSASFTEAVLKFENTDLIVGSSVSPYGLVKVIDNTYGPTRWKVIFDKNSTVSGNITKWASLNETPISGTVAAGPMDSKQHIFFEEGCTFTEGAKPDFKYDYYQLTGDQTALKPVVTLPANDDLCLMAVVKPGTEYVIEGNVGYIDNGSDYTITVPNGTVDLPVGGYYAPEGAWERTDPDVTYALWATESAFLKGLSPQKQFTGSTLDVSAVANGGYVHMFADLTGSAKLHPNESCKLVLNLGGHKFTTKDGLGATNSRVTLILKNGTLINAYQFNFRANAVIEFDNLHFIHSAAALGWGCSPDKWTFRNSIVELNNQASYFFLGSNPISGTFGDIRFENTDIKVNGGVDQTCGLFGIRGTLGGKYFKITLDKDSSITGNIDGDHIIGCIPAYEFVATQLLIIEEGFTFGKGCVPTLKYVTPSGLVGEGDAICDIRFVEAGTDKDLAHRFVKSGDLFEVRVINTAIPDTLLWDYESEFAYNGKEHQVSLLPGQIDLDYYTLTYSNNAFTMSGDYSATVTVTVTETGEVVRTEVLEWSIYSPEMPPIPDVLEWDYTSPITMNGKEQGVTLKDGQLDLNYYEIRYAGNTATENGKYTATATVILKANGETVATATLDWKILWAPTNGDLYAVWGSENDYLDAKAPTASYTGELLAANILSSGYVRLFGNVSISAAFVFEGGCDLIIDLAGNTLTTSGRVQFLENTRLVMENGTVNHTNEQFYYRPQSYVTFRNVTFNISTGSNINYGYGCTELRYEGCTLYLNGTNNFFCFGGSAKDVKTALYIKDTDIVINSALNSALFTFNDSTWNYRAQWSVFVDKDSSITLGAKGSYPALVALNENFRYIENGTSEHSKFEYTQNIVFEEGCEVSKGMLAGLGEYIYKAIDYEASVSASVAQGSEKKVYKAAVVLPSSDSRVNVYIGNKLVSKTDIYASPNEDSTRYEILLSADKENDGYYIFAKGSNIGIGYLAQRNDKGLIKFGSADLKKATVGGRIVFAGDSITIDRVASNSSKCTDITIDLGGNTMTLEYAFNLSNYYKGADGIGANQHYSLTFANGTFEALHAQPWYGGGYATSVFTFDNVTVNYNHAGLMSSIYTGTYVIKNSTFNTPNGYAFAFEKSDTFKSVQIENSTFNSAYALRMYLQSSMRLDKDLFYAKNSTFNCKNGVIYSEDVGSTEDSYFVFEMTGCTVNSNSVLGVKTDLPGSETVILSDCKFVKKPYLYVNAVVAENSDNIKIITAEGEKLMAVEGMDGFTYVVDKSPLASGDLQANLTLYTDFQLNIFARPEVIDSILVNGKAPELTTFDGKDKYIVRDITPDTAADTVTITVCATVNGVTYTFDIEYSVLSYAKTVIASESIGNDAKKLVSAAMEYVKAAYVYAGKDAPEFEGVAFDKFTATEPHPEMPAAFGSAQLDLSSGFKLRFNIKEGYNGDATVNGVNYEIVDGAYNGITYFEVDMRAYALFDTEVKLSSGGDSASYTLENYVVFANDSGDEKLINLANALYTYTGHANAYHGN